MNRTGHSGTCPAVILGTWPFAGITSVGVTHQSSRETVFAAIDAGITTFDTAYAYGYQGECDQLLGECIRDRPKTELRIIGKVGQRWTQENQRIADGRREVLRADAIESLTRIGISSFDLLMLHQPDPHVDIRESAECLAELQEAGLCRDIGVCNVDPKQLSQFCEVALPSAIQVPLNLLQRDSLETLVPWCSQRGISVHVYWVLMKGILAGKIDRSFQFEAKDSRPKYPIYQGSFRERTHRLVDRLASIADANGLTVAQLSIGWALSQPGISGAIVGAKRPDQVRETSRATPLPASILAAVEAAVQETAE